MNTENRRQLMLHQIFHSYFDNCPQYLDSTFTTNLAKVPDEKLEEICAALKIPIDEIIETYERAQSNSSRL